MFSRPIIAEDRDHDESADDEDDLEADGIYVDEVLYVLKKFDSQASNDDT